MEPKRGQEQENPNKGINTGTQGAHGEPKHNTSLTWHRPTEGASLRPTTSKGWVPWRSLRIGLDRTGCLQGGPKSGHHGVAGNSGGHGGSASEAVAPAPAPASTAGAIPLKKTWGNLRGLPLTRSVCVCVCVCV